MNSLTKKFILSQLLYDYNIDEINETKEMSFEFICEKKPIIESIPLNSRRSRKNTTKRRDKDTLNLYKEKEKDNLELSKGFIISLYPDKGNNNDKDNHKTFIEEADKIFFLSKDLSNEQDNEKTFAIIQKNNRMRNKDLKINNDSQNNIYNKK
jgi:hypothetical protein